MQHVKIWDHRIGEDQPPFFVAELGICHGGNLDVALELTKAAVEAGAHCVKTETFQKKAISFHPSSEISFTIQGKSYTYPLEEHMAKYELSYEEHHKIKKYCDELKVPFMSTAHDFKSVDFLVDINASSIKIASADIIHYPLLKYVAKKGIPVILDTGGAYQYEAEIAVKILRDEGLEQILVNHNPAGHPAPSDKHDLKIIPRLMEILDIPIGIADHYEGYEMLFAATAIGANLLEKPISMDRFVLEPERNWSISIEDLPGVLNTVNHIYKALGCKERKLTKQAENYRNQNRTACAVAKDLPSGTRINLENVVFGRPRLGIGVEHWYLIENRVLRREKKQHEFIQWDDLN